MSEPQAGQQSRIRWLSREFSELVREIQLADSTTVLDVVIVGSGYGGAIAAAELAGCTDKNGKPIAVCLLERGKEYLPGMFPSRMSDLPTHLRFSTPGSDEPARSREGLFDLRLGRDMNVIVANGLGGGSLINAGVMEVPRRAVFDQRWPDPLQGRQALDAHFQEAKRLLGASLEGRDNTIERHELGGTEKLEAFKRLNAKGKCRDSKSKFRHAAITVAMQDRVNDAGVALKACKRCGDCATGCNYGAKESLDTNLLTLAAQQRARIYTGATVLRIDRESKDAPWTLHVAYTDKNLSEREGAAVPIQARRVILAAGTLGSTEILLRSQQVSANLRFSTQLGQRFSGNGDMIAAGFGQKHAVNAVADENTPPAKRQVGPTITGIIDVTANNKADGSKTELVLEELAVPGPLRLAFEELYSSAKTLHQLGEADTTRHRHEHPSQDPFAVDPGAIHNTQIYAAMGDDGAAGVLWLKRQPATALSDGAIRVGWPAVKQHPLFDTQIRTFEELSRCARLGDVTIANPMWQLLPESMQFLIDNQRGPLLTVHPLGGCAMGKDRNHGVVDELGRVFDGRSDKTDDTQYDGLVVLDGAIIPSALGTNPALTIAAVALRAVRQLREDWGLTAAGTGAGQPLGKRPMFRDAEQEIIAQPQSIPTTGEFTERLSGTVYLCDANGKRKPYTAELTLCYEPKPLRELFGANAQGKLCNPVLKLHSPTDAQDPRQSRLRILGAGRWQVIREKDCSHETRDATLDRHALLVAPLSGTLTIMKREASCAAVRRARSLWAWWRNRGMRDLWQFALSFLDNLKNGRKRNGPGIIARILGAWNLASHAGEVRLFEYDLTIGTPLKQRKEFAWPDPTAAPHKLLGSKRIAYARPSNPFRQLMEMTVETLPCLDKTEKSVLALDNKYMAAVSTPLFRISAQQDQATALTDLLALGAYFLRMLMSIHIWSMRLPDAAQAREPQRLPGKLPGLPEPEIHELEVDRLDNRPVHVRLTRYRGQQPDAIPVLLLHGYSTGGTTFAHPALPADITRHLHAAGRDVWIADLRTSCGMPTANHPWTFETVGLKDIPAAIDHVYRITGTRPVDVVAYCMGAAMLSMAVLSANQPADHIITPCDQPFSDDFLAERMALPERIRRVVLAQVGPLVVFTPRNIFSAYVMAYLRHFLPMEQYQFRASASPGLAEQMLDRILALLPYPDEDLLLENPAWPWRRTSFAGIRHRVDALYGRTFTLGNLDARTLEHLDDFFGPLNPETVSQVLHFVRLQMVANRFGRNRFVFRKALRECWKFPTLSIHGEDNGLADIATLKRMRGVMRDAGCNFTSKRIPGFGHQDCWIGKDAATHVFQPILDFLNQESASADQDSTTESQKLAPAPNGEPRPLLAVPPWAGPQQGPETDDAELGRVIPVSLSAEPGLGRPSCVVLLPVSRTWPDGNAQDGRWHAVAGGLHLPVKAPIPESAAKIIPLLDTCEDWFSVNVPLGFFAAPAEGVLVLTLHGQAETLLAGVYHDPANFDLLLPTLRKERTPLSGPVIQAVRKALMTQDTRVLDAGIIQRPRQSEAGNDELHLALGSCQYPAGLLDTVPAYAAYQRLAERLDDPSKAAPQALILCGDQIYTDATAGLFDPTAQLDDHYRRSYERWLCQGPVRQVMRRLPLIAMLDDHEIHDNWEPLSPDLNETRLKKHADALAMGKAQYLRYQRSSDPAAQINPNDPDYQPLWSNLELQGMPLFLADTRSERKRRSAANLHEARILDDRQFAALKGWLVKPEHTNLPKLIMSPSILLPRHATVTDNDLTHALRSDSWDGYPYSLHALLGFIAEHQIRNVVFLSGDEHLGCVATAQLRGADGGEPVLIHSIHTTALYAPYPFANAKPADLMEQEQFEFVTAGHRYHCDVSASFYPGYGFTLLRLHQAGDGSWRLDCEFERETAADTRHYQGALG
jgi:cholesterol oxidase